MDIFTIILPALIFIIYAAVFVLFIKLVIFSYQAPKRFRELEMRIKQLEEKENH